MDDDTLIRELQAVNRTLSDTCTRQNKKLGECYEKLNIALELSEAIRDVVFGTKQGGIQVSADIAKLFSLVMSYEKLEDVLKKFEKAMESHIK